MPGRAPCGYRSSKLMIPGPCADQRNTGRLETCRAPGERVRSEDQPPVISFRWACRSWQAASSRQAHLLCSGLPQRISLAQSDWSLPTRIILCRGPAQPHIKQVRASTAGHPPVVRRARGDDGGVPEPVLAAGHASRIASSQASSRSSFDSIEVRPSRLSAWPEGISTRTTHRFHTTCKPRAR